MIPYFIPDIVNNTQQMGYGAFSERSPVDTQGSLFILGFMIIYLFLPTRSHSGHGWSITRSHANAVSLGADIHT